MLEERCLPMKNIGAADRSARRAKCGERGWPVNNPPSEPDAAHRKEFFAPLQAQSNAVSAEKRRQRLVERLAQTLDGFLGGPVRAAERLGDDTVDDPQALQVLSGEAQRFRRRLRVLAVAPQD